MNTGRKSFLCHSDICIDLYLGEASLEERHARREVGEAVDPVGNVSPGEDLGEGAAEVVAVPVHQVVPVAPVLSAELFKYLKRRKT